MTAHSYVRRASYSDSADDNSETDASRKISLAIEAYGVDRLETDFLAVYDVIRDALSDSESFSQVIGVGGGGRAPRYFHGVFLGVWELMRTDNMRVRDRSELASRLQGIAANMNVPSGGGDWAADAKRATADAVKGRLRDAMEPAPAGEDLGRYGWATQLETLLGNALVEQQSFECKQGFLDLGQTRDFDQASFDKIMRTATAVANIGPAAIGYVAIGVADSDADASRIANLDAVSPVRYRRFSIVGLEREATQTGTSLDDYWRSVIQRVTNSRLEPELASQLVTDARLVGYRGLVVALFKIKGTSRPFFVDGELVERQGSSTIVVPQSDYARVFRRFA